MATDTLFGSLLCAKCSGCEPEHQRGGFSPWPDTGPLRCIPPSDDGLPLSRFPIHQKLSCLFFEPAFCGTLFSSYSLPSRLPPMGRPGLGPALRGYSAPPTGAGVALIVRCITALHILFKFVLVNVLANNFENVSCPWFGPLLCVSRLVRAFGLFGWVPFSLLSTLIIS